MSLTTADRFGPYEVLALIGKGGMGEVYRARDSKLKRDVALKILPEAFARDPARMARFQREAELLASLNHPNVATIYGVEENALVMEVVDGDTLKGPLPIQDALRLAKQIAEALEYAHERGVIHRDLKPANVKVTPEGAVKLLDFGLAKAIEDRAAPGSLSNSPTLTLGVTGAGVILGTAAYMSPEQAHGKAVDRRADIWSFGAVLYELLTGKQVFAGESVSDTLASVLKLEPDWKSLPTETPSDVRTLLRRCLTKDRKHRLQAIGEARILIEDVLSGKAPEETAGAPVPAPPQSRLGAAGWIAAAILGATAGVAIWGWMHPSTLPPRGVVRFTATVPVSSIGGAMALSRDGSQLAFVGGPRQQIHVRAMDQFNARPIAGTEGASFICFSPDGQSISYISGERPAGFLKRVAVAGGPAQTLANALFGVGPPVQSWAPDDTIFFTNNGELMRISSGGGKPETLARPDTQKGERYYAGPQMLPGGEQLLVSILFSGSGSSGHRVVSLNVRTGERKTVIERAGIAQYAPTGPSSTAGHIVYYDQATASLMAVPFDVKRLEVKGSPAPVLEGIQSARGPFGIFGLSDSGTLVYAPGARAAESSSTLVWVDRNGTEHSLPAPPRTYGSPTLSPDGLRIATSISGQTEDIWVYDLPRGTLDRITSDGNSGGPIWTPDGKRLIYERRPGGGAAVMWVSADGSSPPSVLATRGNGPIVPSSVTPDGKLLMGFYAIEGGLWILPLEVASGRARPQPILASRFTLFNPALSPDGQWVAYRSQETGRSEIYASPYPGPAGKFPLSTDGGTLPRWSRSGRELFFRNGDKMMAIDVQTSPQFRASTPKLLFEKRDANGSYDVGPDGKRFLMIKQPAVQQAAAEQVNVVVNWFEELRRLVPTGK